MTTRAALFSSLVIGALRCLRVPLRPLAAAGCCPSWRPAHLALTICALPWSDAAAERWAAGWCSIRSGKVVLGFS